ncbi:hypothetical protein KVT40_007253 [Elsinoe batatas]|uniref:Uncharacterized protein n=1 Tax=Elsinoe batatas TaxID=2601811 RepID=A0A8K0PEE7_9PEZI|nr:hypothetical protein KVT40_007253 [Elsinoe batatas]
MSCTCTKRSSDFTDMRHLAMLDAMKASNSKIGHILKGEQPWPVKAQQYLQTQQSTALTKFGAQRQSKQSEIDCGLGPSSAIQTIVEPIRDVFRSLLQGHHKHSPTNLTDLETAALDHTILVDQLWQRADCQGWKPRFLVGCILTAYPASFKPTPSPYTLIDRRRRSEWKKIARFTNEVIDQLFPIFQENAFFLLDALAAHGLPVKAIALLDDSTLPGTIEQTVKAIIDIYDLPASPCNDTTYTALARMLSVGLLRSSAEKHNFTTFLRWKIWSSVQRSYRLPYKPLSPLRPQRLLNNTAAILKRGQSSRAVSSRPTRYFGAAVLVIGYQYCEQRSYLRLQASYERAFAQYLLKQFENSRLLCDQIVSIDPGAGTPLENAIRGQIIALRVENIAAHNLSASSGSKLVEDGAAGRWLAVYPKEPTEPEARARLRILLALHQLDPSDVSLPAQIYVALKGLSLPEDEDLLHLAHCRMVGFVQDEYAELMLRRSMQWCMSINDNFGTRRAFTVSLARVLS